MNARRKPGAAQPLRSFRISFSRSSIRPCQRPSSRHRDHRRRRGLPPPATITRSGIDPAPRHRATGSLADPVRRRAVSGPRRTEARIVEAEAPRGSGSGSRLGGSRPCPADSTGVSTGVRRGGRHEYERRYPVHPGSRVFQASDVVLDMGVVTQVGVGVGVGVGVVTRVAVAQRREQRPLRTLVKLLAAHDQLGPGRPRQRSR